MSGCRLPCHCEAQQRAPKAPASPGTAAVLDNVPALSIDGVRLGPSVLQARHSGRQALAGDSARVKQRNIATPPKVIRHVTLGDRARRDGCRGEHRLGDAGPIGSASWLLRQARATCQSAHPQANCAPLYRRLRSTPPFPHALGSRGGRCGTATETCARSCG